MVLQRPKSFKVGHFKTKIEIKCPTSKLSGRGKMMSRDPKIGMESWFGSNAMMEFEAKILKKIRLPYCVVGQPKSF